MEKVTVQNYTTDSPIEKSYTTYSDSDHTLLLSSFVEQKLTMPQITDECFRDCPTLLQELLYKENIALKKSPPFLRLSMIICSRSFEKYQHFFNELNELRASEVQALQEYMINKENLKNFLSVPLNYFGWEELHATGADSVHELRGKKPMTLDRLELIIGTAFETCQRLLEITKERLKTLHTDNLIEFIGLLEDISCGFHDYLLNAVYLNDVFRPINDIINDAASSSYEERFLLWKVLVEIYRKVFYQSLKEMLEQLFATTVTQILKSALTYKLGIDKVLCLLSERDMQRLKEAATYFIDMNANKYTIDQILSYNSNNNLLFLDLIRTMAESIEGITPSTEKELKEFAEFVPSLAAILFGVLTQHTALPVVKALCDLVMKKSKKFKKLDSTTNQLEELYKVLV